MRLIDADALMEKYDKTTVWDSWVEINTAPTIDAVPVVRCWECVKFRRYTKNNLSFGICKHHHSEVSENDFCSYGARKETEGEA